MLKKSLIALLILIVVLFGFVLSMQSSSKWSVGEVVRTPDNRFENLPDYPFQPNYVEVESYRVHYVDEGPKDGPVILLMHGQHLANQINPLIGRPIPTKCMSM